MTGARVFALITTTICFVTVAVLLWQNSLDCIAPRAFAPILVGLLAVAVVALLLIMSPTPQEYRVLRRLHGSKG